MTSPRMLRATNPRLRRLTLATAVGAVAFILAGQSASPVAAQEGFNRRNVEELVDDARRTLRDIDDESRRFRRDLQDAVGIFIFPLIVKAGFIIAVEGGSGVAMARWEDLDPPVQRPPGSPFDWSSPAFYGLAAGSVGFQAGGSGSQVILLFLSRRSFERALEGEFEIGGDINVTIVNQDERAETALRGANVLSYAMAGGLFAGIALEGATINEAIEANDVYYGDDYFADEIVRDPRIFNEHADRLRELLTELGRRDEPRTRSPNP